MTTLPEIKNENLMFKKVTLILIVVLVNVFVKEINNSLTPITMGIGAYIIFKKWPKEKIYFFNILYTNGESDTVKFLSKISDSAYTVKNTNAEIKTIRSFEIELIEECDEEEYYSNFS